VIGAAPLFGMTNAVKTVWRRTVGVDAFFDDELVD
jgi:hypothetical protein